MARGPGRPGSGRMGLSARSPRSRSEAPWLRRTLRAGSRDGGATPSRARLLDPQPKCSRAEGALDGAGQIASHRVEIDLVAKALGECGRSALTVVARPIETSV